MSAITTFRENAEWAVREVVEHVEAHSRVYSGFLTGLVVSSQVTAVINDLTDWNVRVYNFAQHSGLLIAASLFGFITNGISLFLETMALWNQRSILSLSSAAETDTELVSKLRALVKYEQPELELRLGDGFIVKNAEVLGRLIALAEGIEKGSQGCREEGKQLLAAVHTQALKKGVVHTIGFVAAILGIIGLILAAAALPYLIPLMILGIQLTLLITRYFTNRAIS